MSTICHSGLRSEAILLRYSNPNSGSICKWCLEEQEASADLTPLSSLTLHLRRELPIKELSLLRAISLMTSPRKGFATSHISSLIFMLHLPLVLMAFPNCKIIGDRHYQLPGTVCQHLLPRPLTYVFFS